MLSKYFPTELYLQPFYALDYIQHLIDKGQRKKKNAFVFNPGNPGVTLRLFRYIIFVACKTVFLLFPHCLCIGYFPAATIKHHGQKERTERWGCLGLWS